MEKQVVFFGAGASYGAREPRPPLGKELHQQVLRYFDKKYNELSAWEPDIWDPENVRQLLKNQLKNASSYESLANTLWENGQTALLIKLNFLLATFMTPPLNQDPKVDDAFVEKPDVYDEWLKKMFKNMDDLKDFGFITLNYDCLLERAICRRFFTPDEKEGQCLCTHVHYPFIGGPETGVEVLKLHGSINWVGVASWDHGSNEIPTPIFIDQNGITEYRSRQVVRTCFGQVDPQNPDELIMATYAPGKPPQTNPREFEKIRNLAKDRIREAQKIEIIGVHIPQNKQDDPTLWELFQTLQGKNVDFINPSEEEYNLAKLNFNFNPIKKSFKKFVDSKS